MQDAALRTKAAKGGGIRFVQRSDEGEVADWVLQVRPANRPALLDLEACALDGAPHRQIGRLHVVGRRQKAFGIGHNTVLQKRLGASEPVRASSPTAKPRSSRWPTKSWAPRGAS